MMTTHRRDLGEREGGIRGWALLLLALLIIGAGLYYTLELTRWLANDDEGGYLYAAWRISLGEVPYRDFLTPQLPIFLYPGALVLRLTGYSVWAARFYMVVLTLLSATILFLSVRRLWGVAPGLVAFLLMAVQPQVFWNARLFRPEAPMMFWQVVGIYLLIRGYPERRRGLLALAGVAFGLATMSKLFGALAMAGVGLFVLIEGLRTRDWRDMLLTGTTLALPFVITILVIGGAFYALSAGLETNFVAAVLGHHLAQGSGMGPVAMVRKALGLYRFFVANQPVYVALAVLGTGIALWRRRSLERVFLCQLPTALAFLFMTRGLQSRHLTYLVPSLAALGGLGLCSIYYWVVGERTTLARASLAVVPIVVLVGLSLWPQVRVNENVRSWGEGHDTEWVTYVQAHTEPDDVVISDYPGINFFARRPTTPLAAGISRGAAQSGQIMGSDLIREIEESEASMVLLNVAQGAHQFASLLDYEAFKAYVQANFYLAERRQYDYRLMEVYARDDLWPGERVDANLGNQLRLTGADWLADTVGAGEQFQVALRWESLGTISTDYRATLRLVNDRGHEWGLGSKRMADIDRDTYWDEEGLERAVLAPTSQWPVGEETIQVYELPVDAATPPGRYSVLLRVHPEKAWAGLPLIAGDGGSQGYDIELGTVTVTPAVTLTDAAALAFEQRWDVELAPDMRLLGGDAPAGTVRPGDRLALSLYWQATATPASDYELELALGGGYTRLAELRTRPTGVAWPTDEWPAGTIWRGQYRLTVPPDAKRGSYPLVARLLDGKETLGETVLATVTVEGQERLMDAPSVPVGVDATFGDRIRLIGYDVEAPLTVDSEHLGLTLYWQARQSMDVAYTVFVHLLAEGDEPLAQDDAQPRGGSYPTTAWLPDEYVIDEHLVRLPDDLAPGSYRLVVGLYNGATGVRLPLRAAAGHVLPGERLLLGTVRVQEED
jgi:4-amino-4-deoxy-L-arabinose transferase-like glycosyltransferase